MEENGQRKQQATLWWGTEVGKPEEGSLLFVKSTGDFFCFVLFCFLQVTFLIGAVVN